LPEIIRNVVEIGFGVLFIVAAIFHLSYTLRYGKEIYGSFATNAWLNSYRELIRKIIIPHAVPFTVLLIAFQVSIGLMLLTKRGLTEPALIAGAVFSLVIIPASNVRGVMANLILAAILILLVLTN